MSELTSIQRRAAIDVITDDSLISVPMLAKDAWALLTGLQLATKNLGLDPAYRDGLMQLGRKLQNALADYSSDLTEVMEQGWPDLT